MVSTAATGDLENNLQLAVITNAIVNLIVNVNVNRLYLTMICSMMTGSSVGNKLASSKLR